MSELRTMYRTTKKDIFPDVMTLGMGGMTVHYRKVTWDIAGEKEGLRYGDNPDQSAALYKPVDGNIVLGEVEFIKPCRGLVCDMELLQSGKHPGKINLTDVDGALNILKYFTDTPTAVIMKHNNPSGVACRASLAEAYFEANMADRVAAFGGVVVLNRPVDRGTAELIAEGYSEVVAAPGYLEGSLDILAMRKDLRILRIGNIARLEEWQTEIFPDIKSLCDGGIIVQASFIPVIRTVEQLTREGVIPRDVHEREMKGGRLLDTGRTVSIARLPTKEEYEDMLFGWLVETGISSNSVIYVKDRATIGIGTGEQDRVGVAAIARDKAYAKLKDRICFQRYGRPYNRILLQSDKVSCDSEKNRLAAMLESVDDEVEERCGGLRGAVMVSDAFFPFRDGVDVGLKEGVAAVIQPGGSNRDYESVVACNEHNATMVFTGQRNFRH